MLRNAFLNVLCIEFRNQKPISVLWELIVTIIHSIGYIIIVVIRHASVDVLIISAKRLHIVCTFIIILCIIYCISAVTLTFIWSSENYRQFPVHNFHRLRVFEKYIGRGAYNNSYTSYIIQMFNIYGHHGHQSCI